MLFAVAGVVEELDEAGGEGSRVGEVAVTARRPPSDARPAPLADVLAALEVLARQLTPGSIARLASGQPPAN
ncbi:hypothetical protein [Actinoplanes sp. L3-i22]|uniref:hypothetical protein n=1 Tax=Actinoplanes sp. L3-i22 TaxID=2836373 RepID=UPI001C745260|nr:hypothetical protein [Actinoplanes sp. L3-i22]BCY09042.1 hypothetical protein L3i22_041300 [Actinoplanes sp. L3-i22]